MATAQVSREPSVGFPTKGSLRRVPFPQLIREVARHKLDGSLYLLSGATKKVVFFEKGKPVFVRSNVLSECLGQILAQEGLITQEQCEQTLEAIRRTGKKQGELLVEMGILSEGNLRYGLEAQLRAKLFEIFSWEEGRFQFKNDASGLQFGVTLRASAEGVIVEAIQDQYTEERATEALEDVAGKYPVLIEEAVSRAAPSLLAEERHFLACLDGSRTVRELLDAEPDPPVPTPKSLLYGLLVAGLIELSDSAHDRRAWPDAPDLTPPGGTDEELVPDYEAQSHITEYEDTPLPGQLPRSPGLLGDHEDDFDGVGEDSAVVRVSEVVRTTEVAEELVSAEPTSIDETFDDDQIELADDADGPDAPPMLGDLATDDDLALDAAFGEPEPLAPPQPVAPSLVEAPEVPQPVAPRSLASEDDLLDLAPDDDLLLADENLEAAAADLLGASGQPEPLRPSELSAEVPIESIEPVPLDDDYGEDEVEPEGLVDDEVLEVEPDDLEIAELDEDELLEEDDVEPEPQPAQLGDDLLGMDDLDDIDLGGAASNDDDFDLGNAEVEGALRFNEGQAAMAEERWDDAIALLDQAYESGFDVAELHAMLAYARFQLAGGDEQTAHHAFELLDYAQQMDPSLDLVHAYRGAIHRDRGEIDEARESLDRALELNPYCELAMELLDAIG